MHSFELLLKKHLTHPHKLLQIHTLLITTGCFPPKNTTPSLCTTFTYNCLMKCHPNVSLRLFTQMLGRSLQPNAYTFPSLLKPVTALPILRSIHAQIVCRGLLLDNFTNCSLVDGYARFGLLTDAQKTFVEIPFPDPAACNSMLHALCLNGELLPALNFFSKLPNKDIVTWTTIINGLAKNGQFQEAIGIFRMSMFGNYGLKLTEHALVSVLSACANSDSQLRGKEIHVCIIRHEHRLTAFLGTALIDFYGKHGLLNYSALVFRLIQRKEVCTWNALISALACNGKEVEAVNMFYEMRAQKRLSPNNVTFVSVLTACSRGDMVELGLALFDSISNEHGIVPTMEHYGCVADILSRAGRLREAWEFVRRMPMEPDASVLGVVLGACRIHGDAELGVQVGKKLMALEPRHSGRYALLSNIFAEAERWDEAKELRVKMEKAGAHKFAGCSRLDSTYGML